MALCVYTKRYDGPGGALGSHGLPGGLIAPLGKSGFDLHWLALIFGGFVSSQLVRTDMCRWAMAMVSKSLHVPKP